MPDLTPIPDWARLSHRTIVAYGAVCLVAVLCSIGGWALLAVPFMLLAPHVLLTGLAGPIVFGLGHWIGDLVTKRRKGHVVARMLSRNAQSVHGTAIVVGTSCFPAVPTAHLPAWVQLEHVLMLGLALLGLALFAVALSASAHTARRRGRPLVAASFAAVTYAGIGVLLGVVSGAIWIGALALPFAAYFAATALWLIRLPQWDDA